MKKHIERLKVKTHNFLRWTEQYTKTDMVYLAKGGFWLTLDQIISTIATISLALVFANFVPKEIYGTYKYILSIAGILGALTLTGMNTAVTQAVARGFEGTLKKSFWIQIKWNLILLVVAFFGGIYYWPGDKILSISLFIIGATSPLINSANTYLAFLNGKKEFKSVARFDIFSNILSTGSIIATILIIKNTLLLVLVYFVINTLVNLILYFYTIKKFKPNNQEDEESISYGKHLSFINIITTIASYIDNIAIFHFLGSTPLAIYNFACAPVEQIKGASKTVNVLALPKFAEKSVNDINKNLYRKLWQSFLFGLFLTLIYILIIPFVYKIFFPKYLSSILFSQIYALSIPLFFPMAILGATLQSKLVNMSKNILYKINIIPQLILILLIILFTPIWGIMGTILAQVIYRVFSIIVNLFFWEKIKITTQII